MFSRGYFESKVFARGLFARGQALTVRVGRVPRRVDFEAGQWGEFAAGPFDLAGGLPGGLPGGHSGVALDQVTEAAFPDRPASGGAGLAVAMSAGGVGGAYLELDLAAPRAVMHVRMMVHVGQAWGGAVELARVLDAGSKPIGAIVFDAVTGEIRAALESGQACGHRLRCGAELPHGEYRLEEFDTVGQGDGYKVVGLDAHGLVGTGQAIAAPVQFGPGSALLAVNHRVALAVLRTPVFENPG